MSPEDQAAVNQLAGNNNLRSVFYQVYQGGQLVSAHRPYLAQLTGMRLISTCGSGYLVTDKGVRVYRALP